MGEVNSMATVNLDYQEIYADVRAFLLGLIPEGEDQIVQSLSNISTLPHDAVLMNILFDRELDVAVHNYDKEKGLAYVQKSIMVTMQLDFYGQEAQKRSRIVANFWRDTYGFDNLNVCKPVDVKDYRHMPYVNESNQYEDRYSLDLTLQYNPEVTHSQEFVTDIEPVTIISV